jgi:DDE superfamily endonuclease
MPRSLTAERYTPKHASWLNMVEIEIGVMVSQCLDRRIPSKEMLVKELKAWQRRRNRDTGNLLKPRSLFAVQMRHLRGRVARAGNRVFGDQRFELAHVLC